MVQYLIAAYCHLTPNTHHNHQQGLSQFLAYSIHAKIHRVHQEQSAILWENIPLVSLYWYNQPHLYLNCYGYNNARNIWPSCGSTNFTCLMWCVTGTLHMSVLQLIAKPYADQFIVGLPTQLLSLLQLWDVITMPFMFSHGKYCEMHFLMTLVFTTQSVVKHTGKCVVAWGRNLEH